MIRTTATALSAVLFFAACSADTKPVGRVPDTDKEGAELTLRPPDAWTAYESSSTMRFASYSVEGEGGSSVDISITPLKHVEGKDLAYVNLWRGTLGISEPLEEGGADLFSKAKFGEHEFDLFDETSPDAILEGGRHARIYLASITRGEKRWFFKMAGDAELLGSQIPAFNEMLATLRFGGE